MLDGSSYPWLCPSCRARITLAKKEILLAQRMGIEDPDFGTAYSYAGDDEAPCNLVYDRRQFCGGSTCTRKNVPLA